MDTIPAAFRATAASVAPDLATRLNEIIRLDGITVLGYPLGSDDYCQRWRRSCTALTGKHWAAPSSLLARTRARARCGAGALAPVSAAHVPASRV
jgi:hypothetical protein